MANKFNEDLTGRLVFLDKEKFDLTIFLCERGAGCDPSKKGRIINGKFFNAPKHSGKFYKNGYIQSQWIIGILK